MLATTLAWVQYNGGGASSLIYTGVIQGLGPLQVIKPKYWYTASGELLPNVSGKRENIDLFIGLPYKSIYKPNMNRNCLYDILYK